MLFPNQSQFFGSGTGGNNHQSVFEFEGKYYFTYHAPTLNKRINGNTTQGYRSPHIQELAFNADGTIQQVVGTYAGVEQVREFDPFRAFESETFGWSKGIATQKVDRRLGAVRRRFPNLVVKDIDNGDWTALSSVAFGDAGAESVTVKVKPLQSGGAISVRTGSETGPVVGTSRSTGAVGEWTELTAALDGRDGHARPVLHLQRRQRRPVRARHLVVRRGGRTDAGCLRRGDLALRRGQVGADGQGDQRGVGAGHGFRDDPVRIEVIRHGRRRKVGLERLHDAARKRPRRHRGGLRHRDGRGRGTDGSRSGGLRRTQLRLTPGMAARARAAIPHPAAGASGRH